MGKMRKMAGWVRDFLPAQGRIVQGDRLKLLLPTIIMLALVSLLALLVIFQFAIRQNRQAEDDSRHLVRAILQERQFSLENLVFDYAVWDDFHAHAVGGLDSSWIDQNVWSYFRDGHKASFVAVLDPADAPAVLFTLPGTDAGAFWENIREKAGFLAGKVRAQPGAGAISVFHHAGHETCLMAVAPILPRLYGEETPRGILVVTKMVTPQDVVDIGNLYDISGLQLASGPARRGSGLASVRLSSGDDGRSYLQWRPHRPGDETLRILLPGLLVLVIVFFAMALHMLAVWTETVGLARGRENELNAIFSAAADAIMIVDVQGRVRRANASAQAMFGRDFMGEASGVLVEEVIHVAVGRGGISSLWSFLRLAADRSAVSDVEATGQRGGETFPVEISAGLARLTGGDGMVLMVRDITERKQAEAEIIEGRRLAEAASHAKSAFLANMSHEFRTPLNAMLGFSEIICQQMFGPVGSDKYCDYAADIHSSAGHLLHIIQNILELSELESGTVSVHDEMFVPRQVLDEVVVALSGMAEARKVGVVVSGDGPPMLVADKAKFSGIVYNLLDNAIRYTPEGRDVRVRLEENVDELSVFIEDGGIGLDEETRIYLFEPFFRSAHTYSQRKGAGLGLPICRKYAELMGGAIGLEWTSPEGSCFRLRLPAGHVPAFFPPPPST
ncbi:MAG: hypothetical protein A2018_07030 [Alphaproteobacteria bacterium GWF2_58_20]|nr:MAG: hypothetical protein A2018_07030 [Alphaproteobacteria bacterium GWF2_58_20]